MPGKKIKNTESSSKCTVQEKSSNELASNTFETVHIKKNVFQVKWHTCIVFINFLQKHMHFGRLLHYIHYPNSTPQYLYISKVTPPLPSHIFRHLNLNIQKIYDQNRACRQSRTCQPVSEASWVFCTRRCNVANLFSNICSRWSASWRQKIEPSVLTHLITLNLVLLIICPVAQLERVTFFKQLFLFI